MDLLFLAAIFAIVGLTIGLGALCDRLRRRKWLRKESPMDTMINWFQVRGLGALAAIGIFLIYAVLAGWWQGRRVDRNAGGLTEQDAPTPAERSRPNEFDRRAA